MPWWSLFWVVLPSSMDMVLNGQMQTIGVGMVFTQFLCPPWLVRSQSLLALNLLCSPGAQGYKIVCDSLWGPWCLWRGGSFTKSCWCVAHCMDPRLCSRLVWVAQWCSLFQKEKKSWWGCAHNHCYSLNFLNSACMEKLIESSIYLTYLKLLKVSYREL